MQLWDREYLVCIQQLRRKLTRFNPEYWILYCEEILKLEDVVSNQLSGDRTGRSPGRSDMRKRVRKCSEISMTASLFFCGSCCTRYFMASTSRRWPSMKRGSAWCELVLRRLGSGIVGLTGMVNTLAIPL